MELKIGNVDKFNEKTLINKLSFRKILKQLKEKPSKDKDCEFKKTLLVDEILEN